MGTKRKKKQTEETDQQMHERIHRQREWGFKQRRAYKPCILNGDQHLEAPLILQKKTKKK